LICAPNICNELENSEFRPDTGAAILTLFSCFAGGDDRRVLLWNVQKALHNCGKPTVMRSEHHSNIFCLSFDNSVRHIYSAGNDDQVILHDIQTLVISCLLKNERHMNDQFLNLFIRLLLGAKLWTYSILSIQFTVFPSIHVTIIYLQVQAKMGVFLFSIPDSILVVVIIPTNFEISH